MVDSGAAAATDKVLATIREISRTLRPPARPESASPFNSTWQVMHSSPEPKIRMVMNTNDNLDHVGGNANIRKSPMFGPLGEGAAFQLALSSGSSQQIFSHVNVQQRLLTANPQLAPSDTYFTKKYTMWRFVNNQAIQVFHMPNAITDGDSAVWFRGADVIVTGDIYNSDIYPPIDLSRGGTIDG